MESDTHLLESKALIRVQHQGKDRKYLNFLDQREQERRPLSLEHLWEGHSHVFSVPNSVLAYRGSAPAHLALMLASQEAGARNHSVSETVAFKASIQGKVERSGLSYPTLKRAFAVLVKDGIITREKRRSAKGKRQASRIQFTNKREQGFILVPSESLEAIDRMGRNAAAKAVYLSALWHLTNDQFPAETVHLKLADWITTSCLDRGSFYLGLKYCRRKKLLSYESDVLTVNDAETLQPTVKYQEPKVWSGKANPRWGINFDDITDEQWPSLLAEEPVCCPQCGDTKRFKLIIPQKFSCFNCGSWGSLVDYVKQHHGFDWPGTQKYLADRVKSLEITV